MVLRSLAPPLGISVLAPLVLLGAARSPAPQTPAPPQEPAPALTLHSESRIVLADLTVTDHAGNPVHGLTAQDFEVFDDNQQQRISSFEEHDGRVQQAYPPPPPSNGTATNAYQHLPPVLNVILIDTTNLELPDQMYLRIQLTKFLKSLPPNQPLAVFDRHGDYTVLLQPFTADHALLQAAVGRAIPRIPLGGREYRHDADTLRQIGVYLADVPGRKNVLWFSGGSTAYLMYGLAALMTGPGVSLAAGSPAAVEAAATTALSAASGAAAGEDQDALRQVYDDLEAARIVIYPVDARGLTSGDAALAPQQSQMESTAEATGGQAFFNNNGLAQIAADVVSTDSSSYTLIWSPQDFQYDGKWRNIRIVARNRDYHLSYRRGYFADKPHTLDPNSKKHKLFSARDAMPITPPDLRSTPLLFQATVHPASAAAATEGFVRLRPSHPLGKGGHTFAVDYTVSSTGFSPSSTSGDPRCTAIFAILALDANGNRVGNALDGVEFPLQPAGPPHRLQIEQLVNLPKGSDFLSLAIWDPASGHVGTLQIPVTVGSKLK